MPNSHPVQARIQRRLLARPAQRPLSIALIAMINGPFGWYAVLFHTFFAPVDGHDDHYARHISRELTIRAFFPSIPDTAFAVLAGLATRVEDSTLNRRALLTHVMDAP